MICIKCDKNMADCECADAIKRLENILEPCPYLLIGPEYRKRLEAHLRELKRRGPQTSIST